MEWERAKTIILALFVLLNVALGGLRFADSRRYWLTDEQERNIRTVLSNNNILLYTNPVRSFAPMRPIEVSGFYYDEGFLLGLFFYGEEVLRHDYDGGLVVFESGTGRLEKSSGFVSFEFFMPEGPDCQESEVDRSFAAGKTSEFIGAHFPNFEIDIVFTTTHDFSPALVRIYREIFQGLFVYSNFVEFLVTACGIARVDMQFGRVSGESQVPPRMLIPPDNALLAYMQRYSHAAAISPIFITRMDMVYVALYRSDEVGFSTPAIPFYRIFVEGSYFPRLINAFTNELVY